MIQKLERAISLLEAGKEEEAHQLVEAAIGQINESIVQLSCVVSC